LSGSIDNGAGLGKIRRMSMMIDHVAIACRDVEAQRAWYEATFGFHVVFRKPPARPGGQTAYLMGLDGGQTTIELMADDGQPAAGRGIFVRGISHIAFRVDSYERWAARLEKAGVAWLGDAAEATGGGRLRSFTDPEGNILQIVQRQ
jgi:catechol 2,3-dioxygenase-like lactoylglutathione lyase family enzyme